MKLYEDEYVFGSKMNALYQYFGFEKSNMYNVYGSMAMIISHFFLHTLTALIREFNGPWRLNKKGIFLLT